MQSRPMLHPLVILRRTYIKGPNAIHLGEKIGLLLTNNREAFIAELANNFETFWIFTGFLDHLVQEVEAANELPNACEALLPPTVRQEREIKLSSLSNYTHISLSLSLSIYIYLYRFG